MTTANFEALEKEACETIGHASDLKELESLRVRYLGKKGEVTLLLKQVGSLSQENRSVFGQNVNKLKSSVESALDNQKRKLSAVSSEKSIIDATLPGYHAPQGRLHPITQTIREISDLFLRLGFELVDGREIETEFCNFTALNIPLDHPSRDAFDTFYTENGALLRSQTSTVQVRIMKDRKPPLRIIAPGRVYRPDEVDASHSFMFHQIEGLMVDSDVTFSDLKGVLSVFLKKLFGPGIKTRFRPHYFPFTEPSVEIDVNWGKGWLEVLGAGVVNPKVFEQVGYNPKKVKGFAFGLGVERIAMLRYGIKDIRLFYENDIRFLGQFR